MDKLTRPERFATEPNAPKSEKLYKHWKLTFTNYLETAVAASSENNDNNLNHRKFFALINNISADVFEIVSDTENFDVAIQALDNAYIKPTNIVYNRHQRITCKQEPMQSVDTYMQELERIAKSSNFQAVTAEENKQQYIRDAFINGINSPYIRQRLLESSTLSLEDTYRQARTLEQAQKQSASYDYGIVARIDKEDITDQQQLIAALAPKKINKDSNPNKNNKEIKENCYFCGNYRHRRADCPAREERTLGKSV